MKALLTPISYWSLVIDVVIGKFDTVLTGLKLISQLVPCCNDLITLSQCGHVEEKKRESFGLFSSPRRTA
jgi:hypothetical protein